MYALSLNKCWTQTNVKHERTQISGTQSKPSYSKWKIWKRCVLCLAWLSFICVAFLAILSHYCSLSHNKFTSRDEIGAKATFGRICVMQNHYKTSSFSHLHKIHSRPKEKHSIRYERFVLLSFIILWIRVFGFLFILRDLFSHFSYFFAIVLHQSCIFGFFDIIFIVQWIYDKCYDVRVSFSWCVKQWHPYQMIHFCPEFIHKEH